MARARKVHVSESAVSRLIEPIKRFTAAQPWWQTTLLLIGVLTVCSVIGGLFFAVGDKPGTVYPSARVPPVESPEFLAALSHLVNSPVGQGGSVEVLNDGDEFLPALLEGINAAQQTINFSVFIWRDGEFSDQVLDALIRRQRDGVQVRVLLDGLGARDAPGDRFDALEDVGGKVQRFRTPKFGRLTRLHRRNHRRAIVMDGEVGFTGGMAVSDEWLGHAQDPDHWRDMMFRVTGPMARSLQAAFTDMWVSSSGEILVGHDVYPVAHVSDAGVGPYIHLVNSPADDDQSMAYFFLMPIYAARSRIYLATPYFIPDAQLKSALEDKARAGLDVRLLLPGSNIDNAAVRLSGQNHYDELIDAGVKIYEYQPTFVHSKFGVIDGQWSIVGSPNLNSRSRQLDEENVFGILDRRLGAELEEIFLRDLGQSRVIELETWRRRNPLLRLVQQVSQLLDEQS